MIIEGLIIEGSHLSHLKCKTKKKCLKILKKVEVTERNKDGSPSLPLLYYESSVSEKKQKKTEKKNSTTDIFLHSKSTYF